MGVYLWVEASPEVTTFTIPDNSGTDTLTSIEVPGSIQELEFKGTLNQPSSTSVWSDCIITFTNGSGGEYSFYKDFQCGANWSHFNDRDWCVYNDNGTGLGLFQMKTPTATGAYDVIFKVNKTGVYVTAGANYNYYEWLSTDLPHVENILNQIKYIQLHNYSGTSYVNNTVAVTYEPA